MKHYLMLSVDKSPQQIILHVGTNNLRDHTPTMVAENIVDLPRKIEMKTLKLSVTAVMRDVTHSLARSREALRVKKIHVLDRSGESFQRPFNVIVYIIRTQT